MTNKKHPYDEITVNVRTSKTNNSNDKKNNKKSNKKKNKNYIVLKVILLCVFLLVVLFLGLFIKRMNENGWTLGGFVATILGHDSTTLANLSRIDILLIGQSQNLTDTLLICSYNPKTQSASLISIPRDTFVGKNKNYATTSDKINSIYQYNPDMLLQRVNELTGMNINYYVKVDTQGLRDLVDSIGGIYFDVPIDMNYDDPTQDLAIHVKAGYQLLDGNKAEQVVRFRHNNNGSTYPAEYGQEDIGRMKTQRAFLTAVVQQLAKPENLTKVDDYIRIANNNVETNFNIWNLKDYAPYILDFEIENLVTKTLPGVPEKCNEIWLYICNKQQTKNLINELFATPLTDEQEENSKINVSILNGTSDEMNLDNLEKLLKECGYNVISTESTTLTKTTIIINRTNQDAEVAQGLKNAIGVGIIANSSNNDNSSSNSTSKPNSNNKKADFTIVIGEDY